MADGREMWLSTRATRPADESDPHGREVRSIDSWLNPCVEGTYVAGSLDAVWEMLDLLPKPARVGEYQLLFMDTLAGDR